MTTPTASSADRRPGPDEISLVALATSILRRRHLVAWCGIGLFTVVVALAVVGRRVYSARASFIPSSVSQGAGLSGLAAQIGLSLPAGEATQSPDFYASLVRSREVLGAVVNQRFAFRSDTGQVDGTLLDILGIFNADSLRRREAGINALGGIVSVSVDKRANVVRIVSTTRYPALSQLITQRILDEVNRFNLARRQSRAESERLFTEHRLDEVRADLRSAEDRLQGFLSTNRDYRNSPLLSFQFQRLERDVQMRQQVYTSLSQAFEQAKIESVRDTPVITVVEQPEIPARPDPRGLLSRGIMSMIAGLIFGMALAVGLDKLEEAERAEPAAYGELARLRTQLWRELRRPWELLRPSRRTGSSA